MLESETQWKELASALVAIAKVLKFDGWLLNVENNVKNPAALLEFVRFLHTTLHQELLEPVLIWYDSVTVDGKLSWQNGLNDRNKAFFEACDGIFTNYSWSERDVAESARAAAAGSRLADLYVGVDVWGRNFFGGGQFNTGQAIKIAHEHGCSLAIFAPAWTHEAIDEDAASADNIALPAALTKHERFMLRDRAFWCSIWPYLNTKLPCSLPFQTSFCRGQGKKRRLYGEVICPVPWYNLRHAQYQPNSVLGSHGYLISKSENIQYLKQLGAAEDGVSKWRQYIENSMFDGNDLDDKTGSNSEDCPKNPKRSKKNTFHNQFTPKSDNSNIELDNKLKDDSALPKSKDVTDTDAPKMAPKINYTLAYIPEELECLEWTLEDSFIGGSCIKINPSDVVSTEHRNSRLLYCDFHCEHSLVICVVTKTIPDFEDQFLYINLNVVNRALENWEVMLIGRDWPEVVQHYWNLPNVLNVAPLDSSSPEFRQVQKYLMLREPAFYVPMKNAFGWKVRYFEVTLPEARVTSVSCRTGHPQGPLLLGHLGLCSKPEKTSKE